MFARLKIELGDRLRLNPLLRYMLCQFKLFQDRNTNAAGPQSLARAVSRLCDAARLAPSTPLLRKVERRINRRMQDLDVSKLDLREFAPEVTDRRMAKAAVLKPWISEREKGVVFASFEHQWARLLWQCDLNAFAQRYTLVVSPTWSPPHGLINYVFPAAYPGKIITLISNNDDVEHFRRISAKNSVVPLLASNWVNSNAYRPIPFEKKDIDILMIANFGAYKRHHALFRALRDLPNSVRVRLIGTYNGKRTSQILMAEAQSYGVAGRFELLESTTDEQVLDSLVRSKISLILSRREGSCVAVVESFFANTPAGIYRDAGIGSRRYINEQTGRFLEYANLAGQLKDFIANAHRYAPRKWALDNKIDCLGSTAVLNEALKKQALADGSEWTQDIAPHHWRPDPLLVYPADLARMQGEIADIRKRFGVRIG